MLRVLRASLKESEAEGTQRDLEIWIEVSRYPPDNESVMEIKSSRATLWKRKGGKAPKGFGIWIKTA